MRIVSLNSTQSWTKFLRVALLAASLTAAGCHAPVHSGLLNGFCPERLDRLRSGLQQQVDDGHFAGAVAMIVRDDETVLLESFGMRDRETAEAMPVDAIFRIYSMTKPVTSVAIMMLQEQGRLSLRDPVSKYLPELGELEVAVPPSAGGAESELSRVATAKRITIYDLLRHTSGLTYGSFGDSPVDRLYVERNLLDREGTLDGFITQLSTLPLKHQPDTVWEYSVSTDVLARVVEVVSGTPINVFFNERIFEPLGMVDTAYFVPESKLARLATIYRVDPDAGLVRADDINARDATQIPKLLAGGTGLFSTARDYARFCRMIARGGELDGERLLAPSTVNLMTTDHLGTIPHNDRTGMRHKILPRGHGFGLGFAVRLEPGGSPDNGTQGNYFWKGSAGTGFWIDPQERLIGVFMIQNFRQSQYRDRDQFKSLVYQALID